jgi:hypothetical protein
MKRLHIVRTVVIAAAMAATMAVSAFAQGESGKIEVVGGDVYNWGEVPPGKLHAEIKVKNIGDTPLRILEAKPSCGCTTPSLDDSLLAPGEIATVTLSLDATSRTGPIEKSLTIHSTDPETPYRFVRLQADIKRSLTIQPSTYFIVTGATKGVEIAAAPLHIINTGKNPFTVSPPVLASGNVTARFAMTEPRELQPGDTLELPVWVTPNDANMLYGAITLKTTNPENETLDLGLTGTMAPPQTATPAQSATPPEQTGHGSNH